MDFKCLHQYFEDSVQQAADQTAVVQGESSVSYRSLNARANRIGHLLATLAASPGAVVATLLPASIDWIATLLGIFKSGHIYLPMDRGFSQARMKQIFTGVAPAILITNSQLEEQVMQLLSELEVIVEYIVVLDGENTVKIIAGRESNSGLRPMQELPAHNLSIPVDPAAGNYIVFTSGSTGGGKAILGSHRSLSHFIQWEIQEFSIRQDCRVSQLIQTTFDASFRDIFVPLCAGGTLCIPPPETKTNIPKLADWIEQQGITLIHCVPSLFRLLSKELGNAATPGRLRSVKHLLMAGEMLYAKDINDWRRHVGDHIELVNLYGASETTLIKTFHRIGEVPSNGSAIIPVGKPLSHTAVAIINADHICKVGEIGEVYVKTVFSTKGYYNDPGLTARVFVQNPLVKDREDIVYKTGDLGRYLPDRTIEILGRMDNQVKVRGIRVELGEIEQAALKMPGIEEVVVLAHKNAEQDTELVCYYTGDSVTIDNVRAHLQKEINENILPDYFMPMKEFPLNINGKVDRKSLPKPEKLSLEEVPYEPVENDIEQSLERIWQEVLGRERIGRKAPFFKSGGTSLRAIQIISRIYREFDVELIIADIFSNPTIAAQARLIQGAQKKQYQQIPAIAESPLYALSHAQKRLWIIDQLETGKTAYNIFGAYLLEGKLDRLHLSAAFEAIVDRHESLRTVFIGQAGEPWQKVCTREQLGYQLEYIDLSTETNAEETALALSQQERERGFDLERGPLIRTKLLQLDHERCVFLLTLHHIIADGWSMEILVKEILTLYQSYEAQLPNPLKPLRIQYRDYAAWQLQLLRQEGIDTHRGYWKERLQGELPVLELPTDHRRPALKTNNGQLLEILLPLALAEKIKDKGRSTGASVFMVLLAAVKVLLHRYSGQHDIIVGTPVAGRDHIDLEDQVGFYVNTLALRTQLDGKDNFDKVLSQAKQLTLEAYTHQLYPFDRLVEELDLVRDMSRMPVFDVMVSMQNIGVQQQPGGEELARLSLSDYETASTISKFDLEFIFREQENGIALQLQFSTDLYNRERMEKMARHYTRLMEQLLSNSQQAIGGLDYLHSSERRQLLNDFNDTQKPWPQHHTLVDLFEEQALQTPHKVAVIAGQQQLTFQQLNEKANQLGRWLRKRYAIKADDLVAIMIDRSEWMIIGMLGILKAGAGYLPVDTTYPEERKAYIMADSGALCILVEEDGTERPEKGMRVGLKDWWDREIDQEAKDNIEKITGPQHIAYTIYTSGSTGTPKGCVVEHGGVVNTLHWMWHQYALGERDIMLQRTPVVFDVSVTEIFLPLCFGASLVMGPKEINTSAELLIGCIDQYGVTTLQLVPSLLHALLDAVEAPLPSLRHIMAAGEALLPADVNRHYQKLDIPLYNIYGPTEASVFATHYQTQNGEQPVPIGKPIDNTCIYIVNESMQLQPIGVEGEICISGPGLARAYLGRETLTTERFVPIPWAAGTRMYRTGDRGRWRADGHVEYLGRKDNQVKLRGYRIELEEIEQTLSGYGDINSAVVVKRQKQNTPFIAAYFTSPQQPAQEAIRQYLAEKLPSYMIPAYLVQVNEFPLTASGKIDRNRLPDPFGVNAEKDEYYRAPATDLEKALVAIWQNVLGRKRIGVNDSFFELGGDSIKSIQVSTRLYKLGYKADIRDFFVHPTIKKLAQAIRKTDNLAKADQSTITGPVPLTPIQQLFFDTHRHSRHHYNQSVLLHAAEGYEGTAVEAVFTKLQLHHDALRMVYRPTADTILQETRGAGHPVSVQEFDLREASQPTARLEAIANDIQAGIDLQQGPLLRVALFKMNDGDRLLMVIHHLVIDGISWRILFEDFATLYQQYKAGEPLALPAKTHSFKLWAEQLQAFASSPAFLQEKNYWQSLEATSLPPLRKDFDQPASNQLKDTTTLAFELNEQDTELLLTRVNRTYATEINDILIAALAMAISNTMGQRQVLIALEGHGRENILPAIDINRTVGWFTSLYPVIVDIDPGHDLSRQIREVKEILRKVPNKGMGHGLLKYLTDPSLKEDIAFNLQPEICFNYLGQFDSDLANASLQTAAEAHGAGQSGDLERPYLFDVSGLIAGGRLVMTLTWNEKHFSAATVNRIKETCYEALRQIIAHCAAAPETILTPADLTWKLLSIDELAAVAQADMEDIYPLSPMQEAMVFHHLFDPADAAYFQQVAYRIHGTIIPEYVGKSLHQLSLRYDILRTTFLYNQLSRPLQMVLRDRTVDFIYEDLRHIAGAAEKEERVVEYKKSDHQRLFRLDKDVLLRVAVLQLSDREFEFVWSHHHILMDGWCMGILTREFYSIYNSYVEKREYDLPATAPYKGYIQWLMRQDQQAAGRFWQEYLAGFSQPGNIPGYKGIQPIQLPRDMQKKQFSLGPEKTARLMALAGRHGVTLNTVIQAIWGILLGKYNQANDVVFGSVVAGRPASVEGIETMVGLFINTIPVRVQYTPQQPFSHLLRQLQQEAVTAASWHYYPLAEVQAAHPLKHQLLNHIMVFENYPLTEQVTSIVQDAMQQEVEELTGMEVFETNNYDLTITVFPRQEITIRLDYNAETYDAALIGQIPGHFLQVLAQILEHDDATVSGLSILSTAEQQQLLMGFNDTAASYPQHKTLVQLFEEQVKKQGDQIALAYEDRTMTYDELDRKSSRVGDWLQKQYNIQPDDRIAVLMDRSEWMIIAILGILRSGAAYVPVDPYYPLERRLFMIEDAAVKCILTDQEQKEQWTKVDLVNIQNIPSPDEHDILPASQIAATSSNIAYVIYTSGSTGQPKGCVLEHGGVVNRIDWMWKHYGFSKKDIILHKTPITFDVSVWEIFLPLCFGARLVVGSREVMYSPEQIIAHIASHAITVLHFVPSLLYAFTSIIEEENKPLLHSLRCIFASGEALTAEGVRKHYEKLNVVLHNLYGPTEASVDVTHYTTRPGDRLIPIGKPISNIKMYVLNEELALVPAGVEGEICISGKGLARGYLNREALTQEKFLDNPYQAGERLYRTGDRGRWTLNGNIEYLGRKDNQVKIRGYRVELGEIEQALGGHAGVEAAVVVARGEAADRYLVAYYKSPATIGERDLRKYLEDRLPVHLLPAMLVCLEQFPLTSSGKIDRSQLPDPVPARTAEVSYTSPANGTEEKLAAIWQQILGGDRIGVHDNFFELGGHSIKAVRVAGLVAKILGKELGVREIFTYPSIHELGKLLDARSDLQYQQIPAIADSPLYALSHAQKRLWIIDQLETGKTAYNLFGSYLLKGKLTHQHLSAAFEAVVDRHESLRTIFISQAGEPWQKVCTREQLGYQLEYIDLSTEANAEEMALALSQQERERGFDLERGPLIRTKLLQLDHERWVFLLTLHHIIADGWSMEILVKEILTLYQCYEAQLPNPLKPLRIQYRDYAAWQQQLLRQEGIDTHRGYWKECLQGELPVLELPMDYRRPELKTNNGQQLEVLLSPALAEKIKDKGRTTGASVFMVLLAAVKVLLYRYSGQQDIIVGTPVAGRDHADLEDQIGFYVNTLALRTQLNGQDHFEALLRQIKQTTLEAYAHQLYPFDRLVEELDLVRDMSRMPVFDVMVSMQNIGLDEPHQETVSSLSLSGYETASTISKFDLEFIFRELENGIFLQLQYSTDLYSRERMEKMATHFTCLLEQLLSNSQQAIGRLDYLHGSEREQLLKDFNDTERPWPQHRTLAELFEEQALQTPDKTAVIDGQQQLTYRQLHEKASQLGHYLLDKGLKQEDIVAVCMDRSMHMMVAILGIWKAGGAYTPVDTNYPAERVQYILQETQCNIVLTSSPYISLFDNAPAEWIISLDAIPDELNDQTLTQPFAAVKPAQLAYIIYTSGSTGAPKGVMIEHQGMLNHLCAKTTDLSMNEGTVVAQTAPATFDISVWQMWSALMTGGKTILYNDDLILSPADLVQTLEQDGVTIWETVPAYLSAVLAVPGPSAFRALHFLLVTGEAVSPALIAKWFDQYPTVKVVNAYGPTEASDDICHHIMTEPPLHTTIPVGKPVQNMQIYILDNGDQLCPVGIPGEICVAGIGVGRGYWNDAARTAARFVPNPFQQGTAGRLYRTGDTGRWLTDGTIEYLGRKDEQVKVRGYRIELGEIENNLAAYPGIEAAAAAVWGESPDQHIVAYYKSEKEYAAEELKQHLQKKLPGYMVPAWLVWMQEFPHTASGKIDRKKLPAPAWQPNEQQTGWAAPANELQKKLAAIWEKVLNRERISIRDNFFLLGGHSLKATQLVYHIAQALEVKVELRDIFMQPTIESMAALISEKNKTAYESIPLVEQAPYYPLSHGQKRLWIIDQMEPGSTTYNIAGCYLMEGQLQPRFLEQAFNDLVDRHEILRTVFVLHQGQPFQQVSSRSESGYRMDFTDLSTHPDADSHLQQSAAALWSHRFDLATGPLFKTQLLQLDQQRFVFMLCMHHIIADGWSMEVMLKEVMQLYASYVTGSHTTLPPLRIQYKDYAAWQHTASQQQAITQDRNYWLQQLAGELPILSLPTDHRRPAIKTYRGAVASTVLPTHLLPLISTKCNQLGLSTFMLLLAAVKILFHRYTGQQDIITGVPVAGRDHLELENQLGFYVNTLALRTRPHSTDNFDAFLQQVKQVTLDGYAHQAYPFDQLVEELQLPRDMGRMPVFDVMVTHQNSALQAPAASLPPNQALQVQEYGSQSGMSKFDMLFFFRETTEDIGLQVEYSTDLFSRQRMENLLEHYCLLLQQLLTDGSRSIGAVTYLPPGELALLNSFNPLPVPLPPGATLVDLISIQAQLRPTETALLFADTVLTYEQLHTQSNQLAHYLRQQGGIQKGQLVALLMERSHWFVIALLGVLKAGAGYLPLDPAYPAERLHFMLQDAGTAGIITSPGVPLMDHPQQLCLPDQWDLIATESNQPLTEGPADSDIAYVIYTSGSTGTPKGCVVEHRAILNTIHWFWQQYHFTPADRLLARTPVIFDVSVMELLTPLCFGASVVISATADMSAPAALAALIERHHITTVVFVPSLLAVFEDWVQAQGPAIPALHSLRQFMATGEALSPQTVNKHYQHWEIPLYNLYGPTEAAVEATHYLTRSGQDLVLIGKPVSNTQVYIVDAQHQLVPIGVEGEICLGGTGLARGYLNREELTRDRFIDNPFEPGQRLYRTGDRGRWLPDGNIEYLGRKDEQVKLRGYRIELGEIEQALQSYESIEQAVVVARGQGAGQYLAAYYKSRGVPEGHHIREYLSGRLPAYMVPAQLVQVSAFTLTPSGKIDRKRLPDPLYPTDERPQHISPRNELEQLLAQIWERVLGKQHIGIYDNFFELGGNSLHVIQIHELINGQFSVPVTIADLYSQHSIDQLAAFIKAKMPREQPTRQVEKIDF